MQRTIRSTTRRAGVALALLSILGTAAVTVAASPSAAPLQENTDCGLPSGAEAFRPPPSDQCR